MSQSTLRERPNWRFSPRLEILFTANRIISVIWDTPQYTPATGHSFIRVFVVVVVVVVVVVCLFRATPRHMKFPG